MEGLTTGEAEELYGLSHAFVPAEREADSLIGDLSQVIINLRAEADPEILRRATLETLSRTTEAKHGVSFEVEHLEHFRPGKPEPTHRIEVST